MNKTELLSLAKDTIVEADEKRAIEIIEEAKRQGIDLLDLLLSGFGEGNQIVGDRFDKGIISLPELIYAAEVMKSVTNMILDYLDDENGTLRASMNKGVILLATVLGDVHDIGKGIVASTLRNAGFTVIDVGCDVPIEDIIEEAKKHDVDIIGTSALLTSTLLEQKRLEKKLEEEGLDERFKTMVGGAPCTERWARKIGADAYSEDAIEAVRVALELMEKKKEKKE